MMTFDDGMDEFDYIDAFNYVDAPDVLERAETNPALYDALVLTRPSNPIKANGVSKA